MNILSVRRFVRDALYLCVLLLALCAQAQPTVAQGPAPFPSFPMPGSAVREPASPESAQTMQVIAQNLGYDKYSYDAMKLPTSATWEDTLKYYSDQVTPLGWKMSGTPEDFKGDKLATFVNPQSKIGFTVLFGTRPDGTRVFALSGVADAAQVAANPIPSKGKLGADGKYASTGPFVADLGFRADKNGFTFANYGNGYTDLTPDEVQRIYGDKACKTKIDGKCVLHPQMKEWMDTMNKQMQGGHCTGISVTALRFFQNKLNVTDYGAANVADLKIWDSEKLQREIAYDWVGPSLPPIRQTIFIGTPSQVVDKLIDSFKPGANATETYTVFIYKPGWQGGHAVTPYAVEDLGDGVAAILIYDNNWVQTQRAILVDRKTDRWSYQASINPSVPSELYWGDASTQSLMLYPTSSATKLVANAVPCWLCANDGKTRIRGMAQTGIDYNEIYLEGSPGNHAHLLVTDEQGRRTGFLPSGKFVNEIPGVETFQPLTDTTSWDETEEPIYYVPVGIQFTLTIDGSLLTQTDLTNVVMVGPGYDLGVDDINMDPGQKDVLIVSADGKQLSYKTASGESPSLIIGTQTDQADYAFEVKGLEMTGGGTISINLDMNDGQLDIKTSGTQGPGTYGLWMDRIDDVSEQIFSHDQIILSAGDTAYVDFSKWTGDKTPMTLEIDHGSDGTIDETLTLNDEN